MAIISYQLVLYHNVQRQHPTEKNNVINIIIIENIPIPHQYSQVLRIMKNPVSQERYISTANVVRNKVFFAEALYCLVIISSIVV